MATITDSLILTSPTPTAFRSMTLARWTSEILISIEEKYGARDNRFTFVGIEFEDRKPQTWFHPAGRGLHVAIRLNKNVWENPSRALFQLAHECVHLLDPSQNNTAPVIEEGLAVLTSREFMARIRGTWASRGKYARAGLLAEQALRINPNVVRNIRAEEVPFVEMTPGMLLDHCTGLDPAIAETLCSRFSGWIPDAETE